MPEGFIHLWPLHLISLGLALFLLVKGKKVKSALPLPKFMILLWAAALVLVSQSGTSEKSTSSGDDAKKLVSQQARPRLLIAIDRSVSMEQTKDGKSPMMAIKSIRNDERYKRLKNKYQIELRYLDELDLPIESQPNVKADIQTSPLFSQVAQLTKNMLTQDMAPIQTWIVTDGLSTDRQSDSTYTESTSPINALIVGPANPGFDQMNIWPESYEPDPNRGFTFQLTLRRTTKPSRDKILLIKKGTLTIKLAQEAVSKWPIQWTSDQNTLTKQFAINADTFKKWQRLASQTFKTSLHNLPLTFVFNEDGQANTLSETILISPAAREPRVLLLEGRPNLDTRMVLQLLRSSGLCQVNSIQHMGMGRYAVSPGLEASSDSDPASVKRQTLRRHDLVIAGDLSTFNNKTSEQLEDYVRDGGHVIHLNQLPQTINGRGEWRYLETSRLNLDGKSFTLNHPSEHYIFPSSINTDYKTLWQLNNSPLLIQRNLEQGSESHLLFRQFGQRLAPLASPLKPLILQLPFLPDTLEASTPFRFTVSVDDGLATLKLAIRPALKNTTSSSPDKLKLEITSPTGEASTLSLERTTSYSWEADFKLYTSGLYQITLTDEAAAAIQNSFPEVTQSALKHLLFAYQPKTPTELGAGYATEKWLAPLIRKNAGHVLTSADQWFKHLETQASPAYAPSTPAVASKKSLRHPYDAHILWLIIFLCLECHLIARREN